MLGISLKIGGLGAGIEAILVPTSRFRVASVALKVCPQ